MGDYSLTYTDAAGDRATIGFKSGPSPREIARSARDAVRALERVFAARSTEGADLTDVDVDGLRVDRIARAGADALPIAAGTRLGDLPGAIERALAPEPPRDDPADGAPSLGELPQTELLRRTWLASAALGPDPDESALAAYDALMGEVERRLAGVRTRLGTLVAEVVEPEAGYAGIQVSLVKPDGTGGLVSWTEVGPEESYGQTAHTFSYDGVAEEPVMTVCDPDGEWMRDDMAALAPPAAPAPDPGAVPDWKARNRVIAREGDDAVVMRELDNGRVEYVVAHGYIEETGHWSYGTYKGSLAAAAAELEGKSLIDGPDEVIDVCVVGHDDVALRLMDWGVEDPTPEVVGRVAAFMGAALPEELEGRAMALIDEAVEALLPDIAPADVALRAAGAHVTTPEEIDRIVELGPAGWREREFPDLLAAPTPEEVIVADNSSGELFISGFADVRAACEWLKSDCTEDMARDRAEEARESIGRRDRPRRKF